VLYLYCGEIQFGRLRSQHTSRSPNSWFDSLGSCSPKSMYRLADKFGLEDLKKKSAEAIRAKLSANNVVDELFSRFTSLYPALVEMEIEVFQLLVMENGQVLAKLEEIIPEVVQGRLPYCGAALWKILSAGLDRPPPSRLISGTISAAKAGWWDE